MMNADQIVELILDAARESRVLTGGIYKDEPIIRTGRQAFGSRTRPEHKRAKQPDLFSGLGELVAQTTRPRVPVPERIAQMRALARGSARWASRYADPKTFYEQARFMESYTDDYPYAGTFSKYYPTYEDMDTAQLRGYFTWRTRWRAGETPEVPLSFLFVHAYELLMGVGVGSAEEGFAQLMRLRDAYAGRAGNEALATYLAIWLRDYAVYHGLDASAIGRDGEGSPVERAIAVIDGAEQALLASPAPGTWKPGLAGLPSEEDLTFALTAAARYRLERSKLFSDAFDELAECCCTVFARMVDHCARRRKRGFTEGLFGGEETLAYTMYRSAVFFDPTPHPDCTVTLETGVSYTCRYGRWSRTAPHRKAQASAELGDILHETDRVLRLRLGGFPELKEREVPKYVRAIVAEVVDAMLARRAAEEAARVVIDRSALRGIRAAAVRTREALLVDEEREEAPEPTADRNVVPSDFGRNYVPIEPPPADVPSGSLSAEDAAYLRALLAGEPAQAPGGMASLAVDRINEALFDLVGDTVIEFEGDTPRVVEDYADDVREVLG